MCVTQVLENTILVNNSCRVYVMWSCGRNGWGRGERERERERGLEISITHINNTFFPMITE